MFGGNDLSSVGLLHFHYFYFIQCWELFVAQAQNHNTIATRGGPKFLFITRTHRMTILGCDDAHPHLAPNQSLTIPNHSYRGYVGLQYLLYFTMLIYQLSSQSPCSLRILAFLSDSLGAGTRPPNNAWVAFLITWQMFWCFLHTHVLAHLCLNVFDIVHRVQNYWICLLDIYI